MARKIPVPTPIPGASGRQPVAPMPGRPKTWAFSFRFWRQIEYLGVGGGPAGWFVSLLEQLSELSREPIDDLQTNVLKQRALRYHEINWDQKNIPIQRGDLHWLDRDYLENGTEYPIVQVTISKAMGRIIGFWDERDVFNIVLLDRMHNIQPVAAFDHRVRNTAEVRTHYADLIAQVQRVQQEWCETSECPLHKAALRLPIGPEHKYELLILQVADSSMEFAEQLMKSRTVDSFCEIFETGILKLAETNPTAAPTSESDGH